MKHTTKHTQVGAWTFVEMLVAISMSAIFLGAATMVFYSISQNSKRLTNLTTVTIGSANADFYGENATSRRVYTAPNYGKLGFAQVMRQQMQDDAEMSSAVYCLPRSQFNPVRQGTIPFGPGSSDTSTKPALDTPEAFRQFLIQQVPAAASVFSTAIRNVPPNTTMNMTVFMVAPNSSDTLMSLHAVYDIDFVTTTTPQGLYASVRRYKNNTLTQYYDVFYEGILGTNNLPGPQFVAFEHVNRKGVTETNSIERFKIGTKGPFYLLWLPDPTINPLPILDPGLAPVTAPAVFAYSQQSMKSSLMLALPMFPAL